MDRNRQIEEWYHQYSDGIHTFLVYYTGRSDVEDLVHDVFIRAIRHYQSFLGNASAKTWLYSIARHAAIDHERKNKWTKWVPERFFNELRSAERTPLDIVSAGEEKEALYHSLAKLKTNYREVIILRSLREFTVAETADVLQWSESKVNVTFHRALKALKKVHADKEGGYVHEPQ